MPEVTTQGHGSQDALLVRVSAGAHSAWGECEASPLVSIAAFVLFDSIATFRKLTNPAMITCQFFGASVRLLDGCG